MFLFIQFFFDFRVRTNLKIFLNSRIPHSRKPSNKNFQFKIITKREVFNIDFCLNFLKKYLNIDKNSCLLNIHKISEFLNFFK